MNKNHKNFNNQDLTIHQEVLQQMSIAQKYTLFTEIRFLLTQKHVKTQYLDAGPFHSILHVLTGHHRKGKKQWIRYTDRVQELTEQLLGQLDTELQTLKLEHLQAIQQLEETFEMALNSALFLIDLIQRNTLEYDEEQYACIVADVERAERRLEEGINALLPPAVKPFRILRMEPRELAVITENGIEMTALEPDRHKEKWRHLISMTEIAIAGAKGPYDVIIHPHGMRPYGIRADHSFDYNEYQLLHYIHAKHPSPGQKIAVMDYYDCVGYVSGYVMEENGRYRTIFQHREVERGKSRKKISKKIESFFLQCGVFPDDLRFVKCYSIDAHIEKNYDAIQFETIKFDEQWISKDAAMHEILLRGSCCA